MKTYLINTLKNISTINRSLDFVSTVKTSEWTIFNEEKTCIEKFLFVDDEYIYVSVNGKTSSLKWKYIKVNESLIIDDGINKYLFKVIVYNEEIIVLNIDSTNNYSFLINSKSSLKDETYKNIQWYLIRKCGLDILDEKQREIYLEERKKARCRKEEEVRKKELEQKQFAKSFFISASFILVAIVIGYCIHEYIEYKKKHPTLYTTEKQNQIAIDLGLSVKWATCNIGANKPEEYGNYYGWGEPTGTDVFDDSEPVDKLNKRFPARADRFLPPYSIINTSRDIANYNWGEKWRMPTKKEAQELIDKCEIQYHKSITGKKIVKVIGPNGNFIIIPSAGFLDGTSGNWRLDHHEYSIYLYIGELYSSSVSTYGYENEGAYLFIGDTYDKKYDKVKEKKVNAIERYRMLPVRAVMDK
ncbi:MAG: hypothetical protein E7A68_21230 [Phocaeicola vulgatus]|jgi:non-specific serine/threonine protein kinase|uniref:hypothetical protein n=1 Tax=Phocaeicola vulgatus TaxID=821 RepID=UPI0029031089|nr:hypothetical protein [Phocaeicola vulgatus]